MVTREPCSFLKISARDHTRVVEVGLAEGELRLKKVARAAIACENSRRETRRFTYVQPSFYVAKAFPRQSREYDCLEEIQSGRRLGT